MKNPLQLLPACFLLLAFVLTWTAGCSRQKDPAKFIELGDRAFDNREFEKAKIEYINAIRIQPTNAHATLRITKILIAQGQIMEAGRAIPWCRQAFPEDLEIRGLIVEILAAAGGETNRARLMTEITELLERDPANERAMMALVSTTRTPEDLTAASSRIATLKAKAGEKPVFKIAEAEILRRQGDTNGCEAALKQAITLDPNLPNSHASYAAFLFSQRRNQEGEAALRKSSELAPPSAIVRETWARYLARANRADEARAVLDEIVAKAPERISAWALRAELALAEKKPEDAERLLARALGQAPTDPEALRVLAQLRISQGKNDAAIRELEKIAQRVPGSAQNQYQLAVAHLINKDPLKAAAALEQSIQLNPSSLGSILLLADLNINRKDYDRAITSLRDVVNRAPGVEQAHLLLMRAEQAANRPEEALTAANNAFQRFPTNAAIAFQRGVLLRQLQNPAEARKSFEAAAALTTNNLPAIQQLVELDLQSRNVTNALARIQSRLDKFPDDAGAWMLRSSLAIALGDAATAENAARKAVEFAPKLPGAHLTLARAHLGAKRPKDAITAVDEALKQQPDDAESLLLRGELASQQADYPKAREAYEAGIKVRPDSPIFLNNLAYVIAENLNQPEEARQYALKARQLAPKDPSIADTLGWIEYRRGQFPDALRLLTEAASDPLTKSLPEIQFHLGMTHYMMGEEGAARTALQAATDSLREFEGRNTARDFLAMLNVGSGKTDEQAIRALEKRTKDAPGDVVALTRLATAYELTGANEKAQQAYEAALKLNTQSASILTAYATFSDTKLNNPAKATELARRARSLAPGDPGVALVLGRLALRTGDATLAYTLLQEASRASTNRTEIAYDLARASYGQGKVDEAVRTLQQLSGPGIDPKLTQAAASFLEMVALTRGTNPPPAQAAQKIQALLEADPTHGPALFASGLVAEAQGQYPNARKAYETLLARYPAFLPGTRQLAILCAERLGDDAKARDLGSRAREAFPRDDTLSAALGKAVARGGDFNFAVQLLTQASASRSTDASLFYHLGISQQGLKKSAEAINALEKAITLEPGAPFAEDAKKRLKELKEPAAAKAK